VRKRIVKNQEVRDKWARKKYSNDQSPYWEWNNRSSSEEWISQANPDLLSDELEQQLAEKNELDKEKVQAIYDSIKNGVLSANEKTVFKMLEKGLTKAQIGRKLNKTEQEIHIYHLRIQKKLTKALKGE